MTSQLTTESYRAGVIQVTETVFETLLNTSVTALEANSGAPEYALTAAIYYAGLWQGALLIECSEQQASAWSSHIMDLSEPTSEDVCDGLGELANVLAGNLKPALPPGVRISIPWVVAGSDYSVHMLRGHALERVVFADERGPFRVTFARLEP
jgi:chemotaxis protein CheX